MSVKRLSRTDLRKIINETVSQDIIFEEESFFDNPIASMSKLVTGTASDVSQAFGGKSMLEYAEEFEKISLRTISAELNETVDTMFNEQEDMIATAIAKSVMTQAATPIKIYNSIPGVDKVTANDIKAEVKEHLNTMEDPLVECINKLAMVIVRKIRKNQMPYEKYIRE